MISLILLFTIGLAFEFDGYSCDGGGDSAKNFQWMNTYALFQAFVPKEKTVTEGMEQLFKNVAIGSNSGGSWFVTSLLHDPEFQALFKMEQSELKEHIANYWKAIDKEKEGFLDPDSPDSQCSDVGKQNDLSRSVFNSLLKAAVKMTGQEELLSGEDGLCFDKETGVNRFWTLFRRADCMYCQPEPTFDAGDTTWNVLSGMFQDGIYNVSAWNMYAMYASRKFESRMWEFPQWRDDPAMDGPVIPFFLEVDYGGQKVVDKHIDVPYFKDMHPGREIEVHNYDWNCKGPKLGSKHSTCNVLNEDTVSVSYEDFVQPMMDQFVNAEFPKQINYPSSEALVYTGSHWPMAFMDQMFPLIDDGELPPINGEDMEEEVGSWADTEEEVGSWAEDAIGEDAPADEKTQGGIPDLTDPSWILDYMAKEGERILRKITDPEGPIPLSKWLEAFTVRHLRLVQPQVVGKVSGRNVAYSTVDGGVFDNGGYSGTIKGLQQMFPEAKTGKKILAFDGSPSDIERAMGVQKNFSPMPEPWPEVNMGPAEQILEDNLKNPEFVWHEGLSTLSMWKVTTVENPSHGIKGGYEYDFYYLQSNYTSPPFVCMCAEELCNPYYTATVDQVQDVITLLQKLDLLEPPQQPASPQSASARSSSGKAALHSLDMEYHMKEENTDLVMDKEETWSRKERKEHNSEAMVAPAEPQSLAVNFFAVVGVAFVTYGAFKHYSGVDENDKAFTPLV